MEIRLIEDTEGRYGVTDDGRVWSYVTGKFLKPTPSIHGYPTVMIKLSGAFKRQYIHRLVAQAYIPNPLDKPTVNHKNGVKTDNSTGNLEWATVKENNRHAIDTGLADFKGEANGMAKLTAQEVEAMRLKYLGDPNATQDSLAAEFGVHRVLVKEIVTGRKWAHTWKPVYARPPRWKDTGYNRKDRRYTREMAVEIRAKYKAGGCTQRSLAAVYDLPHSTVWGILNDAFNS